MLQVSQGSHEALPQQPESPLKLWTHVLSTHWSVVHRSSPSSQWASSVQQLGIGTPETHWLAMHMSPSVQALPSSQAPKRGV